MSLCKQIWIYSGLRTFTSLLEEAAARNLQAVSTTITKPHIPTSITFTEEDVLKAISNFSYGNKADESTAKYVKELARLINNDPQNTYLPSEFIKSIGTTPYERESEITQSSILHKTKRINVTSISMNKRYCELKKMYQLYSKMPPEVNKYMKMGTAKHRLKELEVHKQIIVDLIDDEAADTLVFELDLDESILNVPKYVNSTAGNEVDLNKNIQIEKDDDANISIETRDSLSKVTTNLEQLAKFEDLDEKSSALNSIPIKIDTMTDEGTPENTLEEVQIVDKDIFKKEVQANLDIVTSAHRYIHVDNLAQVQTEETQFSISLQVLFGRLTKLFSEGVCREVRVVGHYNTKSFKLLNENENFDNNINDFITLSGIIDQLELKSKTLGAVEAYKKDISVVSNTDNFEKWLSCIEENYCSWSDEINVGIRELKTRNRYFITQDVIMVANDQVSIYNKLLLILTSDVKLNFDSWKATCIKRGIDIEQPLSYDLIKIFAASNKFLAHDFHQMKEGNYLFYGDLDASIKTIEHKSIEFSMPQIQSDIPMIASLSGDWKICPTLAHVIARLAQTMCIMKGTISKTMCIDFLIRQDDTTKQITRYYNNSYAEKVIEQGLDLWMGKREATHTTDSKVCGKCPFQNNCKVGQKLLLHRD